MRMRFVFLLVASAASICVAASSVPDTGANAPAYKLVPVTRGDIVNLVTASGTLRPPVTATVVAPTPGAVREVLVADGAVVEAGQVMARLDDHVATAHVELA